VVAKNKAPDLERRGFVANSPLFLLRGCRRAPLYHLELLVWAMVPLLNFFLKDRRNQFECSILYRLLLLVGARYFEVERCRKATGLSLSYFRP
jgi:hypothetical protein